MLMAAVRVSVAACLTCLLCLPQGLDIEGSWEGALATAGGKLRLRLHITRDMAGQLEGKLDSVDQGASGIPVSTIRFTDGVLFWESKPLRAQFSGKLAPGSDSISGTFQQGMELPLLLTRITAAQAQAKPRRPQEPKPPFPYRSEEITFASKASDVSLAGTLTLPKGAGPWPAVILVSGSGPQDRDETLLGHKPFLVLADHLSRNGVAVLRYDDRGVNKSGGHFSTATSRDFADDAEGALLFLAQRKDVRKNGIGLLGHSEGGLIAPLVASRRKDVAFLVLLAAPGVPGSEIIMEQGQRLAELAGVPLADRQRAREQQEKLYDMLRSAKAEGVSDAVLEERMRAVFGSLPNVETQLRAVMSPWFREFLFYDPRPALEKVQIPVLLVNGGKDLQVLAEQNVPPILAALKNAGNGKVTVQRFAELNHLFQHAKTGAPQEYGQIEETMAPEVLAAITTWIKALK
jgi:pimeloyl-ACP methyl ester carboxylesterase